MAADLNSEKGVLQELIKLLSKETDEGKAATIQR